MHLLKQLGKRKEIILNAFRVKREGAGEIKLALDIRESQDGQTVEVLLEKA